MDLKTLISESRTAFVNGQFEKSYELAQKAIMADKASADAYCCAANACMSLEKYDKAVNYYKEAVKNDPKNGDRYFQLGFAFATDNRIADALKSLTRADELKCSKEVSAELYQLMGMICFEARRLDDALINFKRVEFYIGPSLDILNRIAVIYGLKNDIKKGLFTANQIKLLAPSEYIGYRLAFNFLIQSGNLEKAAQELDKAEKYAELTSEYYTDRMTLETELYKKDSDKKHFDTALGWIAAGLEKIKPDVKNVADAYINAAEIYLQMEKPDSTIDCLNAAYNPAGSFNLGFKIIPENYEEIPLTEYDVENMMEEDHLKNEELFGADGLSEIAEGIEPDENGNRDFLTEIDEENEENEEAPYKIDENEKFTFTQDYTDQINRLFIGAYTLKKEYEQVIRYSKMLQGSTSHYSVYMAKYTEVNAMKKLGMPEADSEYEKLINYLKKAMMVDPTDTAALTYRIQCNADIENYDEAEQLCGLLNNAVKDEFLAKIRQARSGGEN